MQQYRVSSESKASPSAVFSLLVRGETWPLWMGVDSVKVERHNSGREQASEMVGDIRIVRTGSYSNREQITELLPDRRFAYVILDGMLLDYKGNVELTPSPGGGTSIEWSASYRMRIPGAAWLMKLYLQRFMQRAVLKLARLAEG